MKLFTRKKIYRKVRKRRLWNRTTVISLLGKTLALISVTFLIVTAVWWGNLTNPVSYTHLRAHET